MTYSIWHKQPPGPALCRSGLVLCLSAEIDHDMFRTTAGVCQRCLGAYTGGGRWWVRPPAAPSFLSAREKIGEKRALWGYGRVPRGVSVRDWIGSSSVYRLALRRRTTRRSTIGAEFAGSCVLIALQNGCGGNLLVGTDSPGCVPAGRHIGRPLRNCSEFSVKIPISA